MTNRKAKQFVFISAVLLFGLALGWEINRFFNIEFQPKELPSPVRPKLVRAESLPLFSSTIDAICVEPQKLSEELYQRALGSLADALQLRTGVRPAIVDSMISIPTGPMTIITVGAAACGGAAGQPQDRPAGREAFSIRTYRLAGARVLNIAGGSPLGDAYGIYWLADELLSERSEAEIFNLNRTIAPALPYRYVDMGAVGITPDAAAWGSDYRHNSRAFEDVMLAAAPYVDDEAFSHAFEQFKDYLHRMIAYGCNGIVFDGFLEFINFDRVGGGHDVYSSECNMRGRHLALRRKFRQLFDYAHSLGIKVVLKTDMLALTPELERFFRTSIGSLDAGDQRLWEVYRLGLVELFEVFPFVDGLMVRTGEAGGIYNVDGWEYYSRLGVRQDQAVQMMLQAFLSAAQEYGRNIYFRNWSIGVGGTGDMHANPSAYQRILGNFNSPRLVVSTKYCGGDFFSYLPHNPTLRVGKQARLVEFQARREFEGFGVLPNYMAMIHQSALRDLRHENPNIQGIWLWTQNGGPLRAGPLALYPFHGFWNLIDANVYATARLAWDPDIDLNVVTDIWVRKNFGLDPTTVDRVKQMLLLSHEAVAKGLYLGHSARRRLVAFGLEPPPTPWMWDLVSGSSSALSMVYLGNKGHLRETLDEGFEAVRLVQRMRDLMRGVSVHGASAWQLYSKLMNALDYEEDLFATLATYRLAFLPYYHWLDTGDPVAFSNWQTNMAEFEARKRQHLAKYADNLDFPAYNFMPADVGMAHAKRSNAMMVIARLVVLLGLCMLILGSGPLHGCACRFPGKAGLRVLWLATATPDADLSNDLQTGFDRFAVLLPFALFAIGLLTFSSFLSVEFPLWLGLLTVVHLCPPLWLVKGERAAVFRLLAAMAGSLLCVTILLMGIVAIRGPVYFWFQFWTSPIFRMLFAALLFAWMFWSYWKLRVVFRSTSARSFPVAAGALLSSVGAAVLVGSAVCAVTGLEERLTAVNNEMAILPLCLSKVLGITTHLNISESLPTYGVWLGLIMLMVGLAANRLRKARPGWLSAPQAERHAGLDMTALSKSASER